MGRFSAFIAGSLAGASTYVWLRLRIESLAVEKDRELRKVVNSIIDGKATAQEVRVQLDSRPLQQDTGLIKLKNDAILGFRTKWNEGLREVMSKFSTATNSDSAEPVAVVEATSQEPDSAPAVA